MKSPLAKIQKECDTLMQEVGKLKYPRSLISDFPTNVMHHYVPKSVSSRLRYDWDNLIPLTNGEHNRLHQAGDPEITNRILAKKGGLDWSQSIRAKGREYHKVNIAMYREVKQRLQNEKDSIQNITS